MRKIISFEEILEESRKDKKENSAFERDNEINHVKAAINRIVGTTYDALDKFIEQLKEDDSNKSEKEKTKEIIDMAYNIEKSIEELFRDMLEETTEKMPSEEEAHLLNAYQYLLHNPNKSKEIYREIKDKKISENKPFTLEQKENQRNMLEKVLKIYRTTKSKISDEEYEVLLQYEINPRYRKEVQEQLGKESIEVLKERLKYVGNEEEKFIEFFKENKVRFNENIKERYIDSLIKCGSILDGFGLLSRYQKQHTRMLANVGLREFAYEAKSKDEKDMDLVKIFDEEILKKLPLQNIIALNTFWINRLAKEIEIMNKARFICQDLGVFEKILKEKSENPNNEISMPTNEDIESELLKLNVVNRINERCIHEIEKHANKLKIEERNNIEVEPYINAVASDYQHQYFEYFRKCLPNSSNILTIDMTNCITANNMIYNLYKGKDASQLAFLENAVTNKQIKNWGYIKDETTQGCVLLGFDIEGLNMPLRLHITQKYLKEFLNQNGLENKMPIYQGDEDFTIYGSRINVPLLMPLDNKRISKLKNTNVDFQRDTDMAQYIEHCKYLINTSNENYPKHLKKLRIIGKGKKEKRKYIIPEEYIDIETKEVFEKDREGKFIKKDLGKDIIE